MSIIDNLRCTPLQEQAILHDKGPALVIAGPGSGKTFIITHRIAHLIKDLGISPEKILVITFTKMAAKEMKQRSALLLPGSAPPVFGTFHSVFFNILKQSGQAQTGILSDRERQRVFIELMEENGLETEDENEFFLRLSGDISRYKVRHALDKPFEAKCAENNLFITLLKSYEQKLGYLNRIDFDDMIIQTHRLLLRRGDMRKKWSERFDYIMIDEFQDIDPLQYACIKLLLSPEQNLFAVGDDDQSIYSFRGANPEIMLGLEKDLAKTKKIILDKNYRCASCIIDVSLSLISHNKNRFFKNISAQKDSPGSVKVLPADTREDECSFLEKYLKNHEGSAAVLCRTMRGVDFFCRKLSAKGIPVRAKGKNNSIFEYFAVKDILAYLRFATTDASRRNFLRLMNRPYRYLSREQLPEMIKLDELIKKYEGRRGQIPLEKLKKDITMISQMRPYAAITYVLKVAGYEKYLTELAGENNLNMKEIEGSLKRFLKISQGFSSIRELIKHADKAQGALNERPDTSEGTADPHEGHDGGTSSKISILTMHASKGLEFDTVFIADATEGNIPHQSAGDDGPEEERRLFYVAMTRAKENLFILVPRKMGYKDAVPSRFIREIKNLPSVQNDG